MDGNNIDVARSIQDLLYEHDAVIIPGFGAFVSTYKPSFIDHVQGIIHPPSKALSFNPDMNASDGLLVAHLQQEADLSEETAKTAVEGYVEQLRTALEKREIVVLDKVGRLYKDFEKKVQFLQDNTNFNKGVYGLPAVQFFPILRPKDRTESQPLVFKRPSVPQKRQSQATRGRWLATALPVLFALAICVVGLSIYVSQKNSDSASERGIHKLPADYRLNKKPTTTDEIDLEDLLLEDLEEDLPDASVEEQFAPTGSQDISSYYPEEDTEEPTLPPTQKECIIIVGQFRYKDGVDKWTRDLLDLGFNPYTDGKGRGGLTRVGVRFPYEDPGDVDLALDYLRKKFSAGAFVLKK